MATTTPATLDAAPSSFVTSPDRYKALGDLLHDAYDSTVNELGKPEISELLVETYGDQGITGFLQLTGAVTNGGTSDQIEFFEVGRRHKKFTCSGISSSTDAHTMTVSGTVAQKYDVLMDVGTGLRYIVQSASSGSIVIHGLNDGSRTPASDATFITIGNMYPQGTNQPGSFTEPEVNKQVNSYAIIKDRCQVNGSQATNVGYVNIGNGDYRWFMYGEGEARKRFMDKREMTLLFGELHDGSGTGDLGSASATGGDIAGTEGYFTALEDRGIQVSNANANPLDSFAEFDDIILELDRQGAPSEYAMYLNRKQDLAIDDMLASGVSTGVTAGLPGQFGAFQNSPDMAVKLGFKSFTRGGYTFHKHDFKLLNDPTLLGASNAFQGVMVPLTTVADARTGIKSPALEMKYKASNGYSREMEHWVTGGGVLGHTNNGDSGQDVATFHYRSEVCLLTRGANQHVLIKG
mgnify:CR=1 FL=1